MNVAAVILIFSFVVVSKQEQKFPDVIKEWHSVIGPHKHICIDESKVEENLAHRIVEYGEFLDNMPLKCYAKCILMKLNVINVAGEVQIDVFKKQLSLTDETLTEKVVQKCKDVKAADLCEAAFGIGKCVYGAVQGALKAQ